MTERTACVRTLPGPRGAASKRSFRGAHQQIRLGCPVREQRSVTTMPRGRTGAALRSSMRPPPWKSSTSEVSQLTVRRETARTNDATLGRPAAPTMIASTNPQHRVDIGIHGHRDMQEEAGLVPNWPAGSKPRPTSRESLSPWYFPLPLRAADIGYGVRRDTQATISWGVTCGEDGTRCDDNSSLPSSRTTTEPQDRRARGREQVHCRSEFGPWPVTPTRVGPTEDV